MRNNVQVPSRLEQSTPPQQPRTDERRRNHEESYREHDAEREEHGLDRRSVLRRHVLQSGKVTVELVGENQRGALRDRDRVSVRFRLLVRPGKDMEIARARSIPM